MNFRFVHSVVFLEMAKEAEVAEFLSRILPRNLLLGSETNYSAISYLLKQALNISNFVDDADPDPQFQDSPTEQNLLDKIIQWFTDTFKDNFAETLEERLAFRQHVPELPNTISGKIITGMTVYDTALIFIILIFIARVNDKKSVNERQPIFIPIRPVRGFRKYAVLLETGHSPAGGTTSGVFVRLCGRLTKSPAFSLSWQNEGTRQLFWSQNKDIFILSIPHYLGFIDTIEVMTDATGKSPPWFLKSIRVLCLDNRKCWKCKANVWLRGDRRPFSFKAALMGALSTKEYINKVFLQNHLWTMMWQRKLGSPFTCSQRCIVQWISVSVGMFAAHFLMYKWPYEEKAQFDEKTGLRIPLQNIIRGDDAVSAGVIGAVAGAAVGLVFRAIIRLITSSRKWARVDDKDDFAHLLNPENLRYNDGAVVIANKPQYSGPKMKPMPPCVDDSVLKILDSLTPTQVEAVKRMVECGDGPCDMNAMMLTGNCCTTKASKSMPQQSREQLNPSAGRMKEEQNPGNRGYRKSIATAMNSFWDTALNGIYARSVRERYPDISEDERTVPGPSAGVNLKIKNKEKMGRKDQTNVRDSKSDGLKVKFSLYDEAPELSARYPINSSGAGVKMRLPDTYDSLSENESDGEIVTKATRTSQEINLRRRPKEVYDNAPWWDDRHRVYVSAPDIGNNHYIAVNERYQRTGQADEECCRLQVDSTFGEAAILNYMDGDEHESPGVAWQPTAFIASGISALALLAALALGPYIVYERLPLPNAHALYYLYAVILCLVFHSTTFCTADAMACAMLATCARRARIARARNRPPVP